MMIGIEAARVLEERVMSLDAGTLSEVREVVENLQLLGIILRGPTLPRFDDLSPHGQALYSALSDEAVKQYLRHTLRQEYGEAFAVAGTWSALVNNLMDSDRIEGSPPNRNLLECYRYYVGQIGIDLLRVQTPAAPTARKHGGGVMSD